MEFNLVSKFAPNGDQPKAIAELVQDINNNKKHNTLLGVTGSGKTFTMANIIKECGKPTLIMAHNKTLAAQLYGEFREFFPDNAVEYFVSYYDYYQPEAYIARSDTYIAKDSATNDEIEKLRHAATAALQERRDVIIIASVSAIYGLGSPDDYKNLAISLYPEKKMSREALIARLIDMQFTRNEIDFKRGAFRSKGDTVDIIPPGYSETAIRVEYFGDEIDGIYEINVVTGEVITARRQATIYPASHYVVEKETTEYAIRSIKAELAEQLEILTAENKLLEAQRLEQRTNFDLEMMEEIGYCQGIENYSLYLTGRKTGEAPFTLIDYFPDDFLLMIDESHVTLPQIRGMYNGDRSRKESLIQYGFRLPSALDNRPLQFNEFEGKVNQALYVSATPGDYELTHCPTQVEQVVRPTGLVDPPITILPVKNQVDHLLGEINKVREQGFRTLVTTLTKRMAEDLTEYLEEAGIRVRYLHSDVKTLERMAIIRDLRLGEFDVLVGINLLREGLDLPEVALVAILDADKEGFLRSDRSLIQIIGRAARNSEGRVIMYADRITDSMARAIGETDRRREKQMAYNIEHGITPKTVIKDVRDVISTVLEVGEIDKKKLDPVKMTKTQRAKTLRRLEKEMGEAARRLDFEEAAVLRDLIMEIKRA